MRIGAVICGFAGAAAIAAGCGGHAQNARHRDAPRTLAPVRTHQSFSIGHSARGRTIRAYVIGDSQAPRAMLLVGCIHGNERSGIAIARRLVSSARPIPGVALWVIPVLNPDGAIADTRHNGRGVDLNRNFPYRWAPLTGYEYSGPHALSEPEARAAAQLIKRIRPRVTIWYHQHAAVVDLSGGDPRVERRYATLVGLPASKLVRYPGSAAGWENASLPGATAFVVELPAGTLPHRAVRRHVAAVLSAARELARFRVGRARERLPHP